MTVLSVKGQNANKILAIFRNLTLSCRSWYVLSFMTVVIINYVRCIRNRALLSSDQGTEHFYSLFSELTVGPLIHKILMTVAVGID